jgi:uncharacterized membrane protein
MDKNVTSLSFSSKCIALSLRASLKLVVLFGLCIEWPLKVRSLDLDLSLVASVENLVCLERLWWERRWERAVTAGVD